MPAAADYDRFVSRSPQGTLFSSSWWLDAVAPGRWRSNQVGDDAGVVVDSGDLAGFLSVHQDTVDQQGLAVESTGRRTLRQVDPVAAERGARTILLARDAESRVHAGGYFVHDARTTYYLMGGSNGD